MKKKISHYIWHLTTKKIGRFFKILWSSQNIWTLPRSVQTFHCLNKLLKLSQNEIKKNQKNFGNKIPFPYFKVGWLGSNSFISMTSPFENSAAQPIKYIVWSNWHFYLKNNPILAIFDQPRESKRSGENSDFSLLLAHSSHSSQWYLGILTRD